MPSHHPVESKVQFQTRLHDAGQRQAQVQEMGQQGKVSAKDGKELPEKPPGPRLPACTQVVCDELTKGYSASRPGPGLSSRSGPAQSMRGTGRVPIFAAVGLRFYGHPPPPLEAML